jgi:interleukin-1 receptor-associated kinase 1
MLLKIELEQLKEATFDFRNDMVLGKGGFGSVYKGSLKEKVPFTKSRKLRIAVKKLGSKDLDSGR